MNLLTKAIEKKLLANGAASLAAILIDGNTPDHVPVVKLFNPCGAATWLLTELEDDGDTAFGLCDMGFGCPELGRVSLNELRGIRLAAGLGIERDLWATLDKPLSEYTANSRERGAIAA